LWPNGRPQTTMAGEPLLFKGEDFGYTDLEAA
jgi:uncharacterized protein with PIN domain